MDIEDNTENAALDEQPVDESFEGVQDAQAQEDEYHVIPLKGMFENWFLDYASYVILERAVPAIEDGLKPVQRRILHSMDELDDGRFNKVANIVGNTMKYHPHGDASIGDALVQLAQKNLLIDMQGNFGNILTGDDAAAPRYIEARLSKFAKEVVFNHKTTDWTRSYDNRNAEPVSLPVKFPLLTTLPDAYVLFEENDMDAIPIEDTDGDTLGILEKTTVDHYLHTRIIELNRKLDELDN